jgi:hypothetical protein
MLTHSFSIDKVNNTNKNNTTELYIHPAANLTTNTDTQNSGLGEPEEAASPCLPRHPDEDERMMMKTSGV